MSKLWGQLKKSTAIGLQYVKEKAGSGETEEDPAYEMAIEHFKEIQVWIQRITDDLDSQIQSFSLVLRNMLSFFSILAEDDEENGSLNKQTLASIRQSITCILSDIENNNLIGTESEHIVSLQTTKSQINQIVSAIDRRRRAQLLCDSTRSALNHEMKKRDDAKHDMMLIKYESLQSTLNTETDNVIQMINAVYTKRFMIIEKPMLEYSKFLCSLMDSLKKQLSKCSLGDEDNSMTFQPSYSI